MFDSNKALEMARRILDDEVKPNDLSTHDLELLQEAAGSRKIDPLRLANMCIRNTTRNLGPFQQIPAAVCEAFDPTLVPA